jgi:hypothetical protein
MQKTRKKVPQLPEDFLFSGWYLSAEERYCLHSVLTFSGICSVGLLASQQPPSLVHWYLASALQSDVAGTFQRLVAI